MIILGVTTHVSGHDTSAALVCDGELVAAAEEERFSRKKHDGRLPFGAIDFCLAHAGIQMADVDFIAFPDQPFRTGGNSAHAEVEPELLRRLHGDGVVRRRSLAHKWLLDRWLDLGLPAPSLGMTPHARQGLAALRDRYGPLPQMRFYDHHRSHAAASYHTSGWEDAGALTMDGRGLSYSSAVWAGRGPSLTRIYAEPFTNSAGLFYDLCTEYLGFGEFGHGKTMGLAPYGNAAAFRERAAAMLAPREGGLYRHGERPSEAFLGFPPRNGSSALQAPYVDFAAACQEALERVIFHAARYTIERTRRPRVALSGGVMYNCAANGALRASGLASELWVYPAAGDAGLSVGAALACAVELGEARPRRLEHAYLGPHFSDAEYERALAAEPRIRFRRVGDVAREAAALLAGGKVIGWFQGRMELGPRALGNRSILADPRTTAMRDRVNRIKHRELWRPLAPVVPAERAPEYFTLDGPSPFMLFATQVRPEKRALVPAIVHVDASARPQTVTCSQNPRLHALIEAFGDLTGIPVLLNTSFNDAGEPIVCRPADAVRTFLATGLDVLVLGDFVAERALD